MSNKKAIRPKNAAKAQELSRILEKINEISLAIECYKAENPDDDVEAILSEQKELLPTLKLLENRELDKFIARAKEQGTKMPFRELEMGILSAGRKDMQNGLAEILDSIKFSKPICTECDEVMDNRGRSKKKS